MKIFSLKSAIWLPRPLSVVFPFFADARNLETLTPPWLRFEVLTPEPIAMGQGTRIDYRLRLRGAPIRWQSEITCWEPPHRFVDEQRRGPYRLWIHEHRFREQAGDTLAEDVVRYAVHGGTLVNRLIVARDLDRIFEYRRAQLQRVFGLAAGRAESQPALVRRRRPRDGIRPRAARCVCRPRSKPAVKPLLIERKPLLIERRRACYSCCS